jgi:hypothetical protein
MEVSYGAYGIVYSNPRFPYYEKCFFDDDDLTYINEDYEIVKTMNEASKIFYDINEYYFEQMNYKNLEKENLPSIFFNKPLGNSLNNFINLTHLKFGFNFNQPLGNSLDNLKKLTHLTFGYNFEQPLGTSLNSLKNLTHLTFEHIFNIELGREEINKLINVNDGKKYKK